MEILLNSHLIEALELPVLGRLVLAAIFGGAIGLEREVSGKEAGLRTNMLICVGAALLTVLSLRLGNYLVETEYVMGDPSRLMAAVISGIGFLGAGSIIQARGSITGLTTAATLWVVAAIGIATGAGTYIIAAGSTFFVLAALVPLGKLEQRLFEEPRYWVKAHIHENLNLVEEVTSRLRNRDFTILNTDIAMNETNLYEVLLEVEGSDRIFLEELSDVTDEYPRIEEINIVPESSSQ